MLYPALVELGLSPVLPKGAYYMWTDSSAIAPDAESAAFRLAKEALVAAVPATCFSQPDRPKVNGLRFCFAKKDSTIEAAVENLRKLKL
jgi:aminotransferase